MARPRSQAHQRDLRADILQAAWQQIRADGAPALSLRAVARSLGITAPAIYNYYPNRDALVTALIREAFLSLAQAQEEAAAVQTRDDYWARLQALGMAYREWAITYPERYQLIFGTPIAGYSAPSEQTAPAAARGLAGLVQILEDARRAEELRWPGLPSPDEQVTAMLQEWGNARAPHSHPEVLYLALIIWSRVHGLVMLEIGHQFPPFIHHPGAVYSRELGSICRQYLLTDKERIS